jgi:hypothetical protein
MTFRPRRPSLGATLNASVEGRPPRWDAPSTLAPVLLTISGLAARTPATCGGAGLQQGRISLDG